MTRAARFLAMAAAVALPLWACSTPTLPLPPPAALTVGPPAADGTVTIEGDVLPGAYVSCLNNDTDRGVIERADDTGHFVVVIAAEVGHYLTIWQQSGTDRGPPMNVIVPAPR